MGMGGMSLRGLMEKWFGPEAPTIARITRMRDDAYQRGYVQVEVEQASGALSLLFFRHADGSWCVFPPCDRGGRQT
ncbi:hypothetical protein BJN34_35590 (plasmid) [Cupriavidus necator]|uniref:Uncharacterized protein n=1 Tax=Cupriavidus necator TaxID=106590 RepID=A0A1U9V2M6_CUPNE|nr:hypothetical protein BJN34_35590 [Cupriavidus necator]